MLERQPLQQDAVDDAEHGRVGADADREREDDDEGEDGSLAQHARRMPQIPNQSIHVCRC